MTAYETEAAAAEMTSGAFDLTRRLAPPIPGSAVWGWAGPLLVTAFGTYLRFDRLSVPPSIVFDETYYADDAYGILRHGVEINHVKNANTLLAQGKTSILGQGGELVVHPPLGKIIMAGGEWLFGLTPFGWRVAVAGVGSLAILMAARVARPVDRPAMGGCVAGVLLALDRLGLDGTWMPVSFVLAPVAAYLASWSGWFASPDGYDRNWAALHGNHTPVWSALDSLYQYNRYMLQFGLGLTAGHPYKSQPWNWLLLSRPVSFYYATPKTCGAASCSQEVLAIGTPFIWYMANLALLACLAWWLIRRDWRAGGVLMGVAAGWLPWFWFALHDHRTEFYFYAVVIDPFLVLAITLCIGLVIGPASAVPARRASGAILAIVHLLGAPRELGYLCPVLAAHACPFASPHRP